MLRFSLEELVAFRREHEVDQFLSISLQPIITIEEQEEYVNIRGVLELTGEYEKGETEQEEREDLMDVSRYIEQVNVREDDVHEFLHHFPIDVMVPKERVADLEDVYVFIESFDYDLNDHQLRLTAEVAIHGIVMEEADERNEEQGEQDENDWLEEGNDAFTEFEPFEVIARKEAYQEDDAWLLEEDENVTNEQIETEENIEIEEKEEIQKKTFQLEVKGRENEINEKRNENALYLTKLFEKEQGNDFSQLKICIVQPGDSLDKIAERYDLSVQQLLRVNHLESTADIHQGQLLYIPAPSVSRV
ncbi:LysM peptidoglycan-binding domain-containing protein [Thermolongibacillus altinsuensis]